MSLIHSSPTLQLHPNLKKNNFHKSNFHSENKPNLSSLVLGIHMDVKEEDAT